MGYQKKLAPLYGVEWVNMDVELRPSPQKKFYMHMYSERPAVAVHACVCVCVCINVDKFVLLTWVTRDLPQNAQTRINSLRTRTHYEASL